MGGGAVWITQESRSPRRSLNTVFNHASCIMMMIIIMGLQSLSFHYDSEIRDKESYKAPKITF